jgi:hypothetical protein
MIKTCPYGIPNGFFPGTDKNFKLPPKLHENIPEYTKENKIKSKLILIYAVVLRKK